MKLQRTTLVLLATALLLGGFVYFYEVQGAQKREAVKTTKQPIFPFKADQIQSLTIYTNKETLEFERTNQPKPGWQMKTPKNAPASDAAVSFLVNLLAEGKSDRSFTIPTTERQKYGLDQPMATVKVELKNQGSYRLILGKPDFNRSFLYAQADPPVQASEQLNVLLVPIDFEYAVSRPLSEWQRQEEVPESPTPSPSPTGEKSESPTPSPSPTQQQTNTPSPSPSPTQQQTNTPSPSPSPTQQQTNTPSPSPSPTQQQTNTPSPSPSPTQQQTNTP